MTRAGVAVLLRDRQTEGEQAETKLFLLTFPHGIRMKLGWSFGGVQGGRGSPRTRHCGAGGQRRGKDASSHLHIFQRNGLWQPCRYVCNT